MTLLQRTLIGALTGALLWPASATAQGDATPQPPEDAPAAAEATEGAPAAEENSSEDAPAEDASTEDVPAEEAEAVTSAAHETGSSASHPAASKSFVVGPQVGVVAPQLFSDLGSWPIFGLEVGYILPFDAGSMRRPLQLSVVGHYTQPGATGSGTEPNLGEEGTSYDWELTERMLQIELAATWRFIAPGEFLSPYATIGPRVYMLESVMTASGNGADFGEHRETKTEYGLIAGGGLDLAVGPGTIFGTLLFSWSDLNKRITGDTSTGAVTLDLGYRLYLF